MLFSLPAARTGRVIGFFAVSALTVAVAAPAARADLKVVTTTTTSGGAGRSTTTTSTNYYKGGKFRSETKEAVILIDGSGKIITLNTAKKTYSEMSFSDMMNNPYMRMVDLKTSVNLKPGGKKKIIVGKPAKNYVYTATIQMSLSQEALKQMKGRSQGAAPPPLPTIVMEGEQWVTESVQVPAKAVANSMSALASLPGMKNLMDKLASIKGLPLESRITMTFKGGPPNARNMKPQVTSSVASSLSEAPLSDSLFKIPADYTKQAAGGFPGMGGAMPAGRARP
jgi:hypothetical protein